MKLKEYIERHREQYDTATPPEGHRERFLKRLDDAGNIPQEKSRGWVLSLLTNWQVAAAVLLFAGVFALFNTGPVAGWRKSLFTPEFISSLPVDLVEAMDYYRAQTSRDLIAIDTLAVSYAEAAEIKESAGEQLAEIDLLIEELRKQWEQQPGNSRLKAALLASEKKRSELVERVVNNMQQQKYMN